VTPEKRNQLFALAAMLSEWLADLDDFRKGLRDDFDGWSYEAKMSTLGQAFQQELQAIDSMHDSMVTSLARLSRLF
jgi:hypothetical protein